MKCPTCGEEVAEGKKYCGDCGHRLDSRPAVDEVESKEDWRPPATWSGWLNQMFWHKLGLPPRGLSTPKFVLYVVLLAGASLVALAIVHGPIPSLPLMFILVDALIIGLIMYWVYTTNR